MSSSDPDRPPPAQHSDSSALYGPPFPASATSPPPTDFAKKHPHAEHFINAATKHVFPDHPAPKKNEGEKQQKPKTSGGIEEGVATKEEKEEIPIIGGTPLDELPYTPAFEIPNMSFQKSQEGSDLSKETINEEQRLEDEEIQSGDVINPIPERLDQSRGDIGNSKSLTSSALLTPKDRSRQESGEREMDVRPGFGASREIGSVRMGASALVSALNALPWDDESSSDEDDEDDTYPPSGSKKQAASVMQDRTERPKFNRLGSSLHTIRPMNQTHTVEGQPKATSPQPLYTPHGVHPIQALQFPFRDNTIARRARRPNETELEYQYAVAESRRRSEEPSSGSSPAYHDSDPSSETSSIGGNAREMLNEVISREEQIGEAEEREEIARTAALSPQKAPIELGPTVSEKEQQEMNTDAALRQPDDGEEEVIEESIQPNESERRRLRKEKLGERLMEVFGLEEREDVLEEMRCWLLRSVMLKGYMYLTQRHICFFANMPDKDNLVVKTGPLSKKASRTKLTTKFWVVLKNDVLSWYESTADPYFPKGNISLQYVYSCDAIEDTKLKLRTAEKNYTFSADTEASRDEWIKAIQKVMFKTQHEGESVKLIIPLEAVLEIDRSPTLEFAETIEVKCVDPEDQMSVESYFFASFQDNERAYSKIQTLLDERPSSELPRVSSATTIQQPAEPLDDSVNTIRRSDQTSDSSTSHGIGLKKIGSVLRPLISRNNDKINETDQQKTGLSIPFLSNKTHKASHDSLDTVRNEPVLQGEVESPEGEYDDGYPPRQTGPPPAGMHHDENKGSWGPSWIRKPASKLFNSSPGSTSASRRKSSIDSQVRPAGILSSPSARTRRQKKGSVLEIVEPAIPNNDDTSSDDDDDDDLLRQLSGTSRRRAGRASFASDMSSGSQLGNSRSDYSMMEASESGQREDDETAQKFRNVFALNEKEELIDHFPGYLYRVLPVSGRFFVSTNYFCFRSSQLLYKTKMIIPIKDLYGLKAQKAFRFDHYGLIVVIKGHEELFLEFSSSKRRKACVRLLEERMEAVRLSSERGETDHVDIESRIMEDLDESIPIESRTTNNVPPVSPSPLFGSTTSTFLEFKPEPMRITCLTIGSRGDVQPYIALCKGLQAEGHTTRIASHGEYRDWVEGHGIEFASVGGDPAELMQMCVDNGMFTVSFLKEGLQKFRGWLDELLTSSWEACQGSDLLIESPSAMGGVHIAEALRIPYFRAFTMPWTRTRAYPHAFAVPEHKRGGSYNYMTYTMFDQVFWRATSGQINRWRKNLLNIESTTFEKLEQHKIPFLYNFSSSIVPPPLDWTEWIHVTGYWFLENADESAANEKKWTPPEGLIDFIDGAHKNGKKVVYIGFGSIVVSDPEEMTRCVVEAVIDSGVCAILSKGWSDRGSKAKGEDSGDSGGADGVKYPPEIFSIDSIDHGWLFPRIDAACHHGGAGTSGASFRAGIPTIIKPFFGDQSFWAERAESLNVGSAIRKLTAEHLAEALKTATTDEKQIAKAKVVGEMIRKENGVAKAIEAIYRDLEYAKSIIKPPPGTDDKALDKVTSLFHTDSIVPFRSRSRSKSESQSQTRNELSSSTENDIHASDDGWSVVSGNDNGISGRSRNGSVSRNTSSRDSQNDLSRVETNKSGKSAKSSGGGILGKNDLLSGLGKALPIPNPFSLKKKKNKNINNDEEDDGEEEEEEVTEAAPVIGTASTDDKVHGDIPT